MLRCANTFIKVDLPAPLRNKHNDMNNYNAFESSTIDGLKQYFKLFFKYSLDTFCKDEN